MKHVFYCTLVLSFVLFSCNSKKKEDTGKIQRTTKYAKYFNILKHKNFTEIQLIDPESNTIEKKYALATDISTLKLKPEYIAIKTPISSIITLNGTDIGMISKLGLTDKIKGVSNIKYIYNPSLKARFKAGELEEINDFAQMNPEKVAQVSKLITYSGFGSAPTNEEKLLKLGVICIPDYDWREIHPLGKAEWIKLFAVLFNCEEKAEKEFVKIEKEFLDLEKKVQVFNTRPSLISGSMIGDFWYMPSGNSYNAFLFEKAKSNFVGKDKLGTGSQTYSLEEVISNYQQTDVWLNSGFSSKKELLQANQKYKYLKAFKTGNMYCYSHNINYFWEMSAVEPQKVLSDLIQILHPSKNSKKKLYFYKKLVD